MAYFLISYTLSLSYELEITFLSLIVGVSYFHIFGEAFLNHILLIFKRISPKQLYPHIKIFFPDSIYLDTLHSTHAFPNTPIIKDKRILGFCAKPALVSLSSLLKSMYQSFSLIQKNYPSKHAEIFEREI